MNNLIVSINPCAWITVFTALAIAAGASFIVGAISGLVSFDGGFSQDEARNIRHFMRCMFTASIITLVGAVFSVFAGSVSEDARKAKADVATTYAELCK